MKSTQVICLLSISLSIGCSNKESLNIPGDIIQDIKSQKALYYLDSIAESKMNNKQKANFFLLKASANMKSGCSLSADTTNLLKAATFFDTQKEPQKKLEVSSYLGLAYEQSNQHKKAFIYYREALDLAERCENAYWISLLHSKIGMIYLFEHDIVNSHIHFKQSISLSEQVKIDNNDIGYQFQVGKAWLHTSAPQKSLPYFKRAMELTSESDIRYTDLQRSAALAYVAVNEPNKAICCLNKALDYESSPQKIAIDKLILMHIYMQKGDLKLAQKHKAEVQPLLSSVSSLEINRYFNLFALRLYTMEGNWEQALKSLQKSFSNEFNIQKYLNAGTMNERLLVHRYGKLKHEHSLFKAKVKRWSITLLLVGMATATLYWILKRRRLQQVYELKKQVKAFEKQSIDYQTTSNELKEVLSRDLEITKRIALFQSLQASKNQSLADKINRLLSINGKNPFEIEWEQFYRDIDRLFDDFYFRLRSRYPQLIEKEVQLCCLTRAGFRTNEIAAIWNQSVFSVQKYRSSIRKKLKTEVRADIIEYIETEYRG